MDYPVAVSVNDMLVLKLDRVLVPEGVSDSEDVGVTVWVDGVKEMVRVELSVVRVRVGLEVLGSLFLDEIRRQCRDGLPVGREFVKQTAAMLHDLTTHTVVLDYDSMALVLDYIQCVTAQDPLFMSVSDNSASLVLGSLVSIANEISTPASLLAICQRRTLTRYVAELITPLARALSRSVHPFRDQVIVPARCTAVQRSTPESCQ
eukprot:gene9928-8817_t